MFSDSSNTGNFSNGDPGMSSPTAVLSCQTGFPSYYCDDYTDRMDIIIDEWKKLNFVPDGIYTGFLADATQADKAVRFIREFKTEDTRILVGSCNG